MDTCDTILPKFRQAAEKVWGKLDERMTINCEMKTEKSHNLASLSMPAGCHPMAFNGKDKGALVYFCREYTIQITPRLLELSEEQQEKVLKHEAIHMGHVTHNKDFLELAEIVGAPFSESTISGKINIQEKVGGRFKDIMTAENLEDAKKKVKEYLETHPMTKLRTQY